MQDCRPASALRREPARPWGAQGERWKILFSSRLQIVEVWTLAYHVAWLILESKHEASSVTASIVIDVPISPAVYDHHSYDKPLAKLNLLLSSDS